jgi:hypothetical protein
VEKENTDGKTKYSTVSTISHFYVRECTVLKTTFKPKTNENYMTINISAFFCNMLFLTALPSKIG